MTLRAMRASSASRELVAMRLGVCEARDVDEAKRATHDAVLRDLPPFTIRLGPVEWRLFEGRDAALEHLDAHRSLRSGSVDTVSRRPLTVERLDELDRETREVIERLEDPVLVIATVRVLPGGVG